MVKVVFLGASYCPAEGHRLRSEKSFTTMNLRNAVEVNHERESLPANVPVRGTLHVVLSVPVKSVNFHGNNIIVYKGRNILVVVGFKVGLISLRARRLTLSCQTCF